MGEDPPRAEALISEYSPPTRNRPQFPALDVSSTNAVDIAIDVIPVRPNRFASADTSAPPTLHLSTHITKDAPLVAANRGPSPSRSGDDSTLHGIPPLTQRRGSHQGVDVQGQSNVRDPPVLDFSLGGGSAHPPVKEFIPSFVNDLTSELSNPSVTEKGHLFFAESTSRLVIPSQVPRWFPYLHIADRVVDISNVACASGNPGIIQNTASLTRQEQNSEEQDELIVDALLAVPLDLDITSDLRGIIGLNDTPQEKDGGSVHIPTLEEVTVGPTETVPGSAPNPCDSSMDVHPPSATRPPQVSKTFLDTLAQAPFHRPRDADGTTITPLNVPMVEESVTHPLDPLSVLEGHPPHGDTSVTGLNSRALRFCTYQRVSPFVRGSSRTGSHRKWVATWFCHASTLSCQHDLGWSGHRTIQSHR